MMSTCGAPPFEVPCKWIQEQESLKKRLVLEDDFTWTISSLEGLSSSSSSSGLRGGEKLRYVGGVDLSFSKDDPSVACGALVVVDLESLAVVHADFSLVQLHIPYAPVFLELLEKMKQDSHPFYPQLHHVDGLTQSGVRQLLEAQENCTKDVITLIGNSGRIWGAAMRSTEGSLKPLFISTGHRILLNSAIKVVKMCCKYRVPEPIRQADIRKKVVITSESLNKNSTLIGMKGLKDGVEDLVQMEFCERLSPLNGVQLGRGWGL
ncbi:Endonuclease V [Cinnamomum micranthum f. kanehirae]|uniref:Endonuclease V n=1 Tax=Cinnamomum micranthum f. kanehirae TaxID=337451 RepID=A0A3S3R1W6_9MAGN|nr:Endonuclease V [Cinnamomum micranthum f. kanehirae]